MDQVYEYFDTLCALDFDSLKIIFQYVFSLNAFPTEKIIYNTYISLMAAT